MFEIRYIVSKDLDKLDHVSAQSLQLVLARFISRRPAATGQCAQLRVACKPAETRREGRLAPRSRASGHPGFAPPAEGIVPEMRRKPGAPCRGLQCRGSGTASLRGCHGIDGTATSRWILWMCSARLKPWPFLTEAEAGFTRRDVEMG